MRLGSSRIRVAGASGFCLFAFCVVFVSSAPAVAQTYREESVGQFAGGKGVRSFRTRKNNVLKGSMPLAAGGDDMKTYYTRYVFPAMTRLDHRDKLAGLRNELIVDLAQAKSAEARAAAYDIILRTGKSLAKNKDYHPATRYNALLLLGQLNKIESIDNRPPVPDQSALGTMISPLRNDGSPAMLRYAAILGVLRHAELCGHPQTTAPFNPRVHTGLVTILLPIVLDEEPPEGVDAKAHAWLRSRAVEAIGHLRYQGEPDVVEPLAQLLVDEDADLDLRCVAAEALGRMASALDPSRAEEMTGRITKLLVDCSNAEAHELFEIMTGGPGGRRGRREGGYDVAPRSRRREGELPPLESSRQRRNVLTEEDIADKLTMPSRRRHLFQLLTIKRGLEGDRSAGVDGIITLSGADTYVNPVLKLLNKMIEDLQDVESDLRTLGGKLQRSRIALMALVPASFDVVDEQADLEAAAIAAEPPAAEATEAAEAAEVVDEAAEATAGDGAEAGAEAEGDAG